MVAAQVNTIEEQADGVRCFQTAYVGQCYHAWSDGQAVDKLSMTLFIIPVITRVLDIRNNFTLLWSVAHLDDTHRFPML